MTELEQLKPKNNNLKNKITELFRNYKFNL